MACLLYVKLYPIDTTYQPTIISRYQRTPISHKNLLLCRLINAKMAGLLRFQRRLLLVVAVAITLCGLAFATEDGTCPADGVRFMMDHGGGGGYV